MALGFPRVTTKFLDPRTQAPARPWMRLLQSITNTLTSVGFLLSGTHADRLTLDVTTLSIGTSFFEDDRGVIYTVLGGVWAYTSGIMVAARPNAPADLGASDTGFLLEVSDFGHLVKWTGAAWAFAPGDDGPGRLADFVAAPPGIGWQLCDGSATTVLAIGAALTATPFTTPNLTGSPAYKKSGAAYTGVLNAASNTGADQGAGTVVAAGVGTTVAAHTHVHATADPPNLVVLPYCRR